MKPEELRKEIEQCYDSDCYETHRFIWDEIWCCTKCSEEKLLALIEREKKAAVEEALQKFGINVYHGKFPKLPPEADAHTKQRAKEIGDYVTEYFKK